MSLEIFKRENLITAWNAYYSEGVKDLYPTLICANQQSFDEYNKIVEYDREKQYLFVKETCENSQFGLGNFKQGASPVEGYNNIQSPFCHAMSDDYIVQNTAHRLYFNIGEQRISFVRALTFVCTDRNIPFYFKWHKSGARADNIVVYSDNENLSDICQAIYDIASLNPQITQSDRAIPMSSEDCGWFGYGVEEGNTQQSFSRKVSNSLYQAFEQVVAAYNHNHNEINAVIQDPQTCEQFIDYIKYMVTEQFAKDQIPTNLSSQMPSAIRNLANMQNMFQDQQM